MLIDHSATATDIRRALERLVGGATPGDRLAFIFSGHGAQMVDGDAATDCICPVDFDWTPESALDVADFSALLGQIPRDCAAVAVFDCCHSGGIGGDATKDMRVVRAMLPTASPVRRRTFAGSVLPRVGVLAACKSSETAADAVIGGKPCGAFTHYLIDALRTPAAELSLTGITAKVAVRLRNGGYLQRPQASGPPEILAQSFLAEVCV